MLNPKLYMLLSKGATGSTNDTQLKNLLHREIVSPNPKIISSIIKQSEYLDEELLSKANNKFYTPDEFNNTLKSLNMASQFFSMHLNILSFLSPSWIT